MAAWRLSCSAYSRADLVARFHRFNAALPAQYACLPWYIYPVARIPSFFIKTSGLSNASASHAFRVRKTNYEQHA